MPCPSSYFQSCTADLLLSAQANHQLSSWYVESYIGRETIEQLTSKDVFAGDDVEIDTASW
jgi:hypothetical protein